MAVESEAWRVCFLAAGTAPVSCSLCLEVSRGVAGPLAHRLQWLGTAPVRMPQGVGSRDERTWPPRTATCILTWPATSTSWQMLNFGKERRLLIQWLFVNNQQFQYGLIGSLNPDLVLLSVSRSSFSVSTVLKRFQVASLGLMLKAGVFSGSTIQKWLKQ